MPPSTRSSSQGRKELHRRPHSRRQPPSSLTAHDRFKTKYEAELARSRQLSASFKEVQARVAILERTVREHATQRIQLQTDLATAHRERQALCNELQAVYQEFKETQDELARQEQVTATADLAAGVAHEVRNPLSIINMSVQYIHGKLGPEDPLREFTEAIMEKVAHLDRVTKELIEYGRAQAIDRRPVDLNRRVDAALRLAHARCRAQRVRVERQFEKILPPVQADPGQLDEVFSNLITNALDAMLQGGVLTAMTKVIPEKERIMVEVRNTGHGISPKKRAWLFKPFFTTKSKGTGLGLAICQRLVHAHGGVITVKSKIHGKDRGTRVSIVLPIRPKEAPTQPNPTQPNPTQPNPTQPNPTQQIQRAASHLCQPFFLRAQDG